MMVYLSHFGLETAGKITNNFEHWQNSISDIELSVIFTNFVDNKTSNEKQ